MPEFGSIIRTSSWKFVLKAITSYIFKKSNQCVLAFKPQNNLLVMNSKNILDKLLLLLHIMIIGFPKLTVLETGIN